MPCDTSGISFDITGSASVYSQMAGVLAGFAFAAITLVLSSDQRLARTDIPSREKTSDATVLAFLVAFVCLIVATIIYAVLAGERGCSLLMGRAASEEFLGGVAFAFSVLLLLYALVQLMANSHLATVGYPKPSDITPGTRSDPSPYYSPAETRLCRGRAAMV